MSLIDAKFAKGIFSIDQTKMNEYLLGFDIGLRLNAGYTAVVSVSAFCSALNSSSKFPAGLFYDIDNNHEEDTRNCTICPQISGIGNIHGK